MVSTSENLDPKNLVPQVIDGQEVIKPAVKPKDMTDEQAKTIKDNATKAVQALISADGSAALTVQDQISNVGIQDQKQVSSSIALLQERMGKVFQSDEKTGVTATLTADIANLQDTLAKINPRDIQRDTWFQILRYIPFLGNWMVNVLKVSTNKRMTLQQFVDHLEESLKAGELMLKQDNAQLKVMYQEIEDKQKIIKDNAYFAETLMEQLSEEIPNLKDSKKQGDLQKVLFRVATRAQDLRAVENVHEQFFVSIEMTRDNNDMLISTVERMLTMGMQVVYVAFAIHAALMRQKNVLEAQKGTRDFIGKMLVSNATLVNQHVKEIGDLYKEPGIAMDKLQSAITQLEQAIEATNRLKSEGITHAQENIVKIKVLTEELKSKVNSIPNTDVKSLEASKTLQLTAGTK